jgi:uncharacterized protein
MKSKLNLHQRLRTNKSSKPSREFQVFAKPGGSICNLSCSYCYYSRKSLPENCEILPMPDRVLEEYISQHIEASPGPVISFSWHGGEPAILGLDYFRKIGCKTYGL